MEEKDMIDEEEGSFEEPELPVFEKFTVAPGIKPKKLEEHYEDFEQLVDFNEDTGASVLTGKKIGDTSGKLLAFKIIEKAKIADDQLKIDRLIREVQIYSKAKHCKNIVPLYDIIETDYDLTFVMELVEGGQLFDKIAKSKNKRLSEEDASRVVRQLAECVRDLHATGICHRDLKPENILCTKGEKFDIKLIDFGLAKFIEINDGLEILKASTSGSLPYIAPEMLEETTTKAIDIWAIGIILYFCLFGNTPFYDLTMEKEDEEAVVDRIQNAKLKLPKDIPVSRGAKEVLAGCLKRDPNVRITSYKLLEHSWVQGVIDKVVPFKKESLVSEIQDNNPTNEDYQKLKASINNIIDFSRDLKEKIKTKLKLIKNENKEKMKF